MIQSIPINPSTYPAEDLTRSGPDRWSQSCRNKAATDPVTLGMRTSWGECRQRLPHTSCRLCKRWKQRASREQAGENGCIKPVVDCVHRTPQAHQDLLFTLQSSPEPFGYYIASAAFGPQTRIVFVSRVHTKTATEWVQARMEMQRLKQHRKIIDRKILR